jgi:hypothetical protein
MPNERLLQRRSPARDLRLRQSCRISRDKNDVHVRTKFLNTVRQFCAAEAGHILAANRVITTAIDNKRIAFTTRANHSSPYKKTKP